MTCISAHAGSTSLLHPEMKAVVISWNRTEHLETQNSSLQWGHT